jgi:P27 family predicted phage terminase small subunit
LKKKNSIIPSHICPEAQLFLDNLTALLKEQNILASLDGNMLNLIGNTYHTYITATNFLLAKPENYIITSPRGEVKAHPYVKIQLDSQIQLDKLLNQFGLSPKSRKEISKPKEKAGKLSPMDVFLEQTKK